MVAPLTCASAKKWPLAPRSSVVQPPIDDAVDDRGEETLSTSITGRWRALLEKLPAGESVLGCVVNGPGEARETDIGLTGGGNGKHMVFLSGVTDHHIQDADMVDHIVRLVEAKAAEIEAGVSQSADTMPHPVAA